MTNESDQGWRFEYPWGRKAPSKRMEELAKQARGVELKKQLLADRFKERMIDFDRILESLDSDMAIAQKCEQDRLRRIGKSIAHRLMVLGIKIDMSQFDGNIDQRMIDDLLNQEKKAKSQTAHKQEQWERLGLEDLEEKSKPNEEDEFVAEDEMFDDTVVQEDEIFSFMEPES